MVEFTDQIDDGATTNQCFAQGYMANRKWESNHQPFWFINDLPIEQQPLKSINTNLFTDIFYKLNMNILRYIITSSAYNVILIAEQKTVELPDTS